MHLRRALAVVHGPLRVAFAVIVLSGTPASAWSRAWARVSFQAETVPFWSAPPDLSAPLRFVSRELAWPAAPSVFAVGSPGKAELSKSLWPPTRRFMNQRSCSDFLLCKGPIRAVLLDVDGTLYHQRPLQCLMAFELSTLPIANRSFISAYRIWQALAHFRRVREELRDLCQPEPCLAHLQHSEVARQVGMESANIEAIVCEWMVQRPLKYLTMCRRRGVVQFCSFLRERGIQIGVFSDHPVIEKVSTLGLSPWVSVALCATDPAIDAFKPHPKGFLRACALWGLPPEEVLYVGDRIEIDAVGAASAGMPCAILCGRRGRRHHRPVSQPYLSCTSFTDLQHFLAAIV
jgi:HAD superfamily hydrolase (TIGR01549 family)